MPVESPPSPGAKSSAVKIGFVCHSGMGGSSRAATRLANALARKGYGVHLFSLGDVFWPTDSHISQHVCLRSKPSHCAQLYWDWDETDCRNFLTLLVEVLQREHLDIVHFHYAQPFAQLLAQASALLGADEMPALIGTLHGTDLTRVTRDPKGRDQLNHALAHVSALTTVSHYMAELAQPWIQAQATVEVIPNFIEDNWVDSAAKPPCAPVSPDKAILLHISNFRPVKNTLALAKMYIKLHSQLDSELWLVGEGPELPAVRALLENSPAQGKVRYWGACSEIHGFLNQATLLLSTSLEESFGLALLEAIAYGVPVVATAVGGVPELISDGKTGILFQPQATDAATQRTVELLRSPQDYKCMRQQARQRALDFRESNVVQRYEALYRRVLQSRPNVARVEAP